jgi:hypothetical protein
MLLSGTISFYAKQAQITGIHRNKAEIALDFKTDYDLYTVVLKKAQLGSFAGEFKRKSDRLTGHVTCDVYKGTQGKLVLMGNWTEQGYTDSWIAQLAPNSR